MKGFPSRERRRKLDYLYDGTFDGFLTCVYRHYYTEKAEGIYVSDVYQENILRKSQYCETNMMLADKVYIAIEKAFSAYDVRRIYRVFLSSVKDREMIILNYLRLGFSAKKDISGFHGNPVVSAFSNADSKVAREIDKMLGLLRFEYLRTGAAYAPCEPEHDIIELIAEHFSDRFRGESFIIHDKGRNKAVVSLKGRWAVCEFDDFRREQLAEDEMMYQNLWKKYFDSIAIEQRRNERCQKNMMPVKYWKNLTEMKF